MNELEDCRSLYPLNITETSSYHIVSQVYEGLVKFNQKDLTIIPCLAESWETNASATVFTFHLRKGVLFHDDACFEDGEGREVTANDFKYCFDKLCESRPDNQGFWLFKDKVIGANEYYHSTLIKKPLVGGVSGVTVLDDYTLQKNCYCPLPDFAIFLQLPLLQFFLKKHLKDMVMPCV